MIPLHLVSTSLLVFALAGSSLAAGDMPPACSVLRKANDVIACALAQGREVSLSRASLEASFIREEIAAQKPNPELDTSLKLGKPNSIGGDVAILYTIETGKKLENRIAQARAGTKLFEAKLLKTKEEVALETVIALYRLRQALNEDKQTQETIETYDGIIRMYDRLPKLGPEQKVEKATLSIARNDLVLQLSKLTLEIKGLRARLEQIMGRSLPDGMAILPPFKRSWDELDSRGISGSAIQLVQAEEAMAARELALVKSNAKSNIKLGPMVEFEVGEENRFGLGVAFSMEMPLSHRYEGNIRLAQKELENARLNHATKRDLLNLEMKSLIEIYRSSAKFIQDAGAGGEIEEAHSALHQSHRRGIIQAGATIELHRQVLDYHARLHSLELNAVEVLWRIYALAGKIGEAKIESNS